MSAAAALTVQAEGPESPEAAVEGTGITALDLRRLFALRQAVPASAMTEVEQSEAAERQRDPDQAIRLLESVQKREPNLAYVTYRLGVLYHERDGNCSRAIKAYRRTAELSEDFAPAFSDLGVCYMENGQYEEALKHLKRALTLSPGYVQPAAAIWKIREEQQHKQTPFGRVVARVVQEALMKDALPAEEILNVDPFLRGVPDPVSTEEPLERFTMPELGIVLDHPVDWHKAVQENPSIYYVTFSPKPARQPGEYYRVGVALLRYRKTDDIPHVRADQIESSLNVFTEFYCQELIRKGQLISRQHGKIVLGGRDAVLSHLTFENDRGFTETEYLLVAYDGHELVLVMCEAPVEEFETYRSVFRRILSTVVPLPPVAEESAAAQTHTEENHDAP